MTHLVAMFVQAVPAVTANAAAPPAPAAQALPWEVHLAGNLAWPLAAVVIALTFWKPLSAFIGSIGSRITKLSVMSVGIELTPATSATDTPLLNEVGDAQAAQISDSSGSMLEQVQIERPADFAIIDIGEGNEWLTSRLYVAAIMLSRMRGAQVFVFVKTAVSTRRRFVALAPLAQLRWSLARKYPWLDHAWTCALRDVFPADPKDIQANAESRVQSDNGAFRPHEARAVTNAFIRQVQRPAPPAVLTPGKRAPKAKAPALTSDWVEFDDGRAERASWVTHDLLEELIPASAFQAWTWAMRDAPRARRTRAVLRRTGDFTALLDDDRSVLRIVNRRAVLEELAAAAGEEPEKSPS